MDDLSTWLLIALCLYGLVVCLDRLCGTKEEVLCMWARELSANKATNGKTFCTIGFEGANNLRGIVRVPCQQYEQVKSGQMIHVRCRVSPLFKTKFNFLFESL